MSNIKVGSKVEVANNGKAYSAYDAFIEIRMPSLVKHWRRGAFPNDGDIGKVVHISAHLTDNDVLAIIMVKNRAYIISIDGLQLVENAAQSIHITADGNTIRAILKDGGKVIKRSKAVCAPTDTFDFETGARIAFDRLCTSLAENSKFSEPQTEDKPAEPVNLYCVKSFKPGEFLTKGKTYTIEKDGAVITYDDGWENAFEIGVNRLLNKAIVPNYLVPEVKRPAKVGEWIKITRSKEERAVEGGVYQFVEERGGIVFIKHPDGMRYPDGAANIGRSEYVVLDGYKPEPAHTAHTTVTNVTIDAKCTSCRRERINEAISTPKLDPNHILDRIERILETIRI